jgi:dihydrofolate reductase
VKTALIAALGNDRVIGMRGKLPWHIPADLQRFKKLTTGHPVVMGRKTFETLGQPLKNRRNVVLTSHSLKGIETFGSITEASAAFGPDELVFVIGGGQVYAQFLNTAGILYLTLIDGPFEGDAWFPPYEHLIGSVFKESFREEHAGFRFIDYTHIEGG